MSATARILKHLEAGKPITGISALHNFGVYRLSDTIWKLRQRGHNIKTVMVKMGKKEYASYRLSGRRMVRV
jgi:hypothetical protein